MNDTSSAGKLWQKILLSVAAAAVLLSALSGTIASATPEHAPTETIVAAPGGGGGGNTGN